MSESEIKFPIEARLRIMASVLPKQGSAHGEMLKMADEADAISLVLEETREALREAWEFPQFPGPGEGLVSDQDDISEQEAWVARWKEMDARVKELLDPNRELKPRVRHQEVDERTCLCGFVADAENLADAQMQLAIHFDEEYDKEEARLNADAS